MRARGGTVREKLNELRTAVKRAVRRAKNTHLEEMAADVERNFERSGSLWKAFLGIKRLAGQSRHAAADLQSVKVDDFQEHFPQLLGTGGTTIPDEIQATRAWQLAHKWMADKSKYATQCRTAYAGRVWRWLRIMSGRQGSERGHDTD